MPAASRAGPDRTAPVQTKPPARTASGEPARGGAPAYSPPLAGLSSGVQIPPSGKGSGRGWHPCSEGGYSRSGSARAARAAVPCSAGGSSATTLPAQKQARRGGRPGRVVHGGGEEPGSRGKREAGEVSLRAPAGPAGAVAERGLQGAAGGGGFPGGPETAPAPRAAGTAGTGRGCWGPGGREKLRENYYPPPPIPPRPFPRCLDGRDPPRTWLHSRVGAGPGLGKGRAGLVGKERGQTPDGPRPAALQCCPPP